MLCRILNYGKYRVYKRGIGYIYKMSAIVKEVMPPREIAWEIIKDFTDISPRQFIRWYKHNQKEIKTAIERIRVFNIGEKPEKNKNVPMTLDEAIISIVDKLASEYGWTMDYILENVSYEECTLLIRRIEKREGNEIKINVAIAHAPKEALKIADGLEGWQAVPDLYAFARERRENAGI